MCLVACASSHEIRRLTSDKDVYGTRNQHGPRSTPVSKYKKGPGPRRRLAACGATGSRSLALGESYEIASGNPYNNNADCEWTATSMESSRMCVKFNSFNTESCCDKVTVRQSGSSSSGIKLLDAHSGSSNLGTVVSMASAVNVRFTSDTSVTRSGFTATIAAACPAGKYGASGCYSCAACIAGLFFMLFICLLCIRYLHRTNILTYKLCSLFKRVYGTGWESQPCPAGQYRGTTGITSSSCCSACPAGIHPLPFPFIRYLSTRSPACLVR